MLLLDIPTDIKPLPVTDITMEMAVQAIPIRISDTSACLKIETIRISPIENPIITRPAGTSTMAMTGATKDLKVLRFLK